MTTCKNQCDPMCDFCIHYLCDYIGEQEGVCLFNGSRLSPLESCEDFYCMIQARTDMYDIHYSFNYE